MAMRKDGTSPRGTATTGRAPASATPGSRAANVGGNEVLRRVPGFIQTQARTDPHRVGAKVPDQTPARENSTAGKALRGFSRGRIMG